MIRTAADAWLGEILGRPVLRVSGEIAAGDGEALRTLTARPAFLYARLPAASVASMQAYEDAGFRVVDVTITLETGQLPAGNTDGLQVGFAHPGDAQGVEQLAREGFDRSRFHLDPRIPTALADTIKARWAANFFTGGRGTHMVVARDDQGLTGFLQLLADNSGLLTIDLIAVAARARRQGLGRAMVAFAAGACPGVRRLRVGTQAANVESLRFYAGLGFQVVDSAFVLHCHGPVA